MPSEEVHIGDDWYLGENNDGDLIFYNARKDEVVKAIDVITGAEDKKGNSMKNLFSIENGNDLVPSNWKTKAPTTPIGGGWNHLDSYNPIIEEGSGGEWDDDYVADPWGIVHNDTLYIFYEGMNISGDQDGKIGVASSTDGRNFTKNSNNPIIDADDYTDLVTSHLSFPYVFRYGDHFYMTPSGTKKILRTSLADFPLNWSVYSTSYIGSDAGIIRHNGLWYFLGAKKYQKASGENVAEGITLEFTDNLSKRPLGGIFQGGFRKGGQIQKLQKVGEQGIIVMNYELFNGEGVGQFLITELTPTKMEFVDLGTVHSPGSVEWEVPSHHQLSIVKFNNEWLGIYDSGSYEIGISNKGL